MLHGVSYKKGCYIGQERNSFTHYRGIIRKRAMPFTYEGGWVRKLCAAVGGSGVCVRSITANSQYDLHGAWVQQVGLGTNYVRPERCPCFGAISFRRRRASCGGGGGGAQGGRG